MWGTWGVRGCVDWVSAEDTHSAESGVPSLISTRREYQQPPATHTWQLGLNPVAMGMSACGARPGFGTIPQGAAGGPRSGSVQEALTKLLTCGVTLALVNSIVVIEDDQSLREMLSSILSANGYDVVAFADGETAVADDCTIEAGLAIIDVGLPGMDGLDVCRRVRLHGRIAPVMMLTARHDVHDRVLGLDAGADDYLVKPFALDEFLARVRALLRRRGAVADDAHDATTDCRIDDLVVDPHTRIATRGDDVLELTRLEFDLLHLFVSNAPGVLTREAIHERIWGYDQDHMSNSLEVFVSQLRRKTEAGGRPRLIHTVRGVGYDARADAPAPAP